MAGFVDYFRKTFGWWSDSSAVTPTDYITFCHHKIEVAGMKNTSIATPSMTPEIVVPTFTNPSIKADCD